MNTWQPADTAPISTSLQQQWLWVYVPDAPYGYGPDGCSHLGVRYSHGWRVMGSNREQGITHWMPLPEPPK